MSILLKAMIFGYIIFGIQTLNAVNIRGIVIDPEDNSAITGAECILKSREVIIGQTVSKDDGSFRFSINLQPSDSVSLTILFPGYERYESTLTGLDRDTDIGHCPLPLTTILRDVVIESENVRRVGASFVMSPMESQINISVHANDLLNNMAIPGLRMNSDNGDINMPGHKLVLMLNGLPADQAQIKAIPASEIVSVEYSTILPPIFSNLGDFMINIHTRKHDSGGNLNAMERIGLLFPETTTIISLSLNKGASRFKLDGLFHYRDFRFVSDIKHQIFTTPEHHREIDIDMSQPYNTKLSQANFEYTFNPDDSLLFMMRSNFNYNFYKMNNYGKIEDSLSGEYNTHESIRDEIRTPSLEAYLSKTFKSRSTIELDMVGTYGYNNYAYSYIYSGGKDIPEVGNITDSKRFSLISTAGYNYKFSDITQLSFTFQNHSSHTRNKYPSTGDKYNINENINSFILYWQQSIGRLWLGIKPGLKYSIIKQNSERGSFIYPSADVLLTYSPSRNFNLAWQTNYSAQDFTLSSLISTPLWDSNYLYSIGNPELKMQKTLTNRLMINYNSGNLRAYFTGRYARFYDIIYQLVDYDYSLSAFCNRYVNGNPANGVSLRLGGGYYNFLNMFSLQGELEFRHLSMSQNCDSFIHNSLGGYFMLSWRYQKYGLFYQQLFPSANMDLNLITKESPASVFTAEYRPDSHWTFQLSGVVYDKRPVYKYSFWTPSYSCEESRDFLKDTNTIRLTITYDLSWGHKYNSTREKSINVSDENSAIAKKNK